MSDSAAVTELKQFDSGWKDVARAILDWLSAKGLPGAPNSGGPTSATRPAARLCLNRSVGIDQ